MEAKYGLLAGLARFMTSIAAWQSSLRGKQAGASNRTKDEGSDYP